MGNVAWSGGCYDDYSAAISAHVRHLWRQGAQIFALGGDHGVTIPILDALDAVGETVHVFHVDAHLDWRAEVGGVPRGYSSPLRWASSKPQITGMDVVEVAPSYDSANGITAIMAGRLVMNILGASWAPDGAMRMR